MNNAKFDLLMPFNEKLKPQMKNRSRVRAPLNPPNI